MPIVNGEEYPYTPRGMRAADKARQTREDSAGRMAQRGLSKAAAKKRRQQPRSKQTAPKKPTAPKRKPRGDAWSKNDELLYKLMGGKSKTRYAEDQATYREFGRTYGGPTDAASVAMRKRRERGDWSFGEKPKKRMGPSAPKQKKGRGGNKKAAPYEDMRKRKRYDSLMGYNDGYVGTPPKKNSKRGAK